ncbi:MAG: nucleoside deaminase [Chlorobiaceae bacterium]|nr:nucleoside deaminase [Chlorobiaceae bacterium]
MPPVCPELLLPPWTGEYSEFDSCSLHSDHDRMQFTIELARKNIMHKTGGPFGAAVFERNSGNLASIGVNLVLRSGCSHNHAEMVAIAIAQHRLNSYTLYRSGYPQYELVTSCEPCAMCFGAIIWSGITRLVCGASSADATAAGFDEGPKPANWIEELEKRGIEVVTGVSRNDAKMVFQHYLDSCGVIYNEHPLTITG